MPETNGKLTSEDGGIRKVMVRLPPAVVDRIDDFAGHTHSSRPDFITDAVRQYVVHVLRESVHVITDIEGLEVSKQAKEMYFARRMMECLYEEMNGYRMSREGTQRVRDVSILISMPAGLVAMVTDTVEATGLFSGNQEFIKVSVWYMFRQMGECGYLLEEVAGFMSSPEGSTSLEEELERIRRELGGERSRRRGSGLCGPRRPAYGHSGFRPRVVVNFAITSCGSPRRGTWP